MSSAMQVFVEWVDSRQPWPGWVLASDVAPQKSAPITSLGHLIDENADTITLAQSSGRDPEQFCGIIVIPRCAVLEIRKAVPGPVQKSEKIA